MKRTILSAISIIGLAATSFGQGTIYLNGGNNTSASPTATTEGQIFINGVLDTSEDVNAEFLYGATSTTVDSVVATLLLNATTPVATATPGATEPASGDVTFWGGALYDPSGNGYQLPSTTSGQTEFFEVLTWSGNFSSYAAAQQGGALTGASSIFSEVLTSSQGAANDLENMSAINMTTAAVPEPGTMALAGLGSLSLFLLRRKK